MRLDFPRLGTRFGLTRSRRLLASSGFVGAGLFLAFAVQLHNPAWVMLAMGMAGFCNDMVMPPSWAACMDIGWPEGRQVPFIGGNVAPEDTQVAGIRAHFEEHIIWTVHWSSTSSTMWSRSSS